MVIIALSYCILKHKIVFSMLKRPRLEWFLPWCKHCIKAGLHYGDYRSKLVHFEAQKNIFYVTKP